MEVEVEKIENNEEVVKSLTNMWILEYYCDCDIAKMKGIKLYPMRQMELKLRWFPCAKVKLIGDAIDVPIFMADGSMYLKDGTNSRGPE